MVIEIDEETSLKKFLFISIIITFVIVLSIYGVLIHINIENKTRYIAIHIHSYEGICFQETVIININYTIENNHDYFVPYVIELKGSSIHCPNIIVKKKFLEIEGEDVKKVFYSERVYVKNITGFRITVDFIFSGDTFYLHLPILIRQDAYE